LSFLIQKTIGFIGLGQMGFPMAKNLVSKLKPSHCHVYDTQSILAQQFQKEASNVIIAKSPAEVAGSSSLIVTMLPESHHVQAVYLGDKGILSNVKSGSLLIDSSTIDPTVSEQVYRACKAKQTWMVDAPVSGGTNGAKAGTLTFMVGAEDQVLFEKVNPVLQCMGKNVVYCGTNGKGQVAKIVNNMLLGISMVTNETWIDRVRLHLLKP
jgi:3-hydroxyisobutyrate dehydrogenase